MDRLVEKLQKHTLVISSYILDKAREVIRRKFPEYETSMEIFLTSLVWEYQYIPHNIPDCLYDIRDKNDMKILHSAYLADVDVLITGDKDFFEKTYDGSVILTPADFVKSDIF